MQAGTRPELVLAATVPGREDPNLGAWNFQDLQVGLKTWADWALVRIHPPWPREAQRYLSEGSGFHEPGLFGLMCLPKGFCPR